MRIPCPNCHATLSVPDSAVGKRIRCPKCQTPFVAAAEEEPAAEAVQAGEPPPAAPPPVPGPRRSEEIEDDEDDRPRRRGRDDEDDEPPRRRRRDEDDETAEEESPRRGGRKRALQMAAWPGYLLMAAGGIDLLVALINIGLGLLAQPAGPPPPNVRNAEAFRAGQTVGTVFGACCCLGLFYGPLSGLMAFAGWKLTQLRSFALVIVAVVFNFLLALFLLVGAGFNVFMLVSDPFIAAQVGKASMITTITLNSVAALVNLVAGVWVCVTLFRPQVREYFR